MLSLKNIFKSYKSKTFRKKALENISLELPSTGMILLRERAEAIKYSLKHSRWH